MTDQHESMYNVYRINYTLSHIMHRCIVEKEKYIGLHVKQYSSVKLLAIYNCNLAHSSTAE